MPTFESNVIVTTSDGKQTVRLDGDRVRIRAGGNGTAGDVALYTTNGNTADAGAATVLLDATAAASAPAETARTATWQSSVR